MNSYQELWLPTLKAARVLGVTAKGLRSLRDRKGGYLRENLDYRYCWQNADGLEWNPRLCRIAIDRWRGASNEYRRDVLSKLKEKLQQERRQQRETMQRQQGVRLRRRLDSHELHELYLQRLRANSGINPVYSHHE